MLEDTQKSGIDFTIVDVETNIKATAYMVSQGMYDLTIVSSNHVPAVLQEIDNLQAQFALSGPVAQTWAVRAADAQLLAAINNFIEDEYLSVAYKSLYRKYSYYPLEDDTQVLSPYDNIVQQQANKHDFDWRLIVAQMYQESHFDSKAISSAGAQGLMQLMPETAKLLGVSNVTDPLSNIRGGVLYMNILRGYFENALPLEEKTWFTLASYNAGYGHLKQARLLAKEMGLDANRWFGNVEKAMQTLAVPFNKKDGTKVRYCRCGQTVAYVQEIRALYNNYARLILQDRRIAHNKSAKQQRKFSLL